MVSGRKRASCSLCRSKGPERPAQGAGRGDGKPSLGISCGRGWHGGALKAPVRGRRGQERPWSCGEAVSGLLSLDSCVRDSPALGGTPWREPIVFIIFLTRWVVAPALDAAGTSGGKRRTRRGRGGVSGKSSSKSQLGRAENRECLRSEWAAWPQGVAGRGRAGGRGLCPGMRGQGGQSVFSQQAGQCVI